MGGSKVNPSLQELKHLKYLDLSMNNFSGAPVPTMIASLVHLEYLNLSNAMFDGLIPPQLGNLSNLHYLDLQGWYYDDLLHVDDLDWLSRVPSLKYLDMSSVNLSKVTNWFYVINSIPALEVLRLSHADLPYVPSPLPTFNLTAITTLDLSGNSNATSAMLRWLSNATSLEYLLLSGCGSLTIESVQVALGALLNLKKLDLSANSLKGEIREILNNVSSRGLKHLDLSWNQLFGDIPPGSLRDLDGEIPPTVGKFVRLEYLYLSNNGINGKIPQAIGNLSNLLELHLSGNKIVGWIPPSIGNLTNLVLDLSSNNLFGSLPSSLGNFTAMVEVQNKTWSWLKENYSYIESRLFTSNGLIVEEYYSYSESILLTTKGEIADYTTILSLVTFIDLSNNQLSGEIPKDLTKLLGLRFLNLSNNHLTGRIPEKMGDMKLLESLDLSVNSLTGEIPSSFSAMHFLERLNLSYNNLSGKIPTSGQLSTFDSWTYVGNKGLCGIPLPDCPVYQTPPDATVKHEDDEKLDKLLEYTSVVIGFVVGFWLFIGTLIMKQAIRFAFFRWIDEASDWIYVQFAVKLAKLKSKWQTTT
nr:PREDICTED: serine/threonine-protein kinase BRI1-like 2 [Musa acuminata subsp. malaccensis]